MVLLHYLAIDDFLTLSPPDSDAYHYNLTTLKHLCQRLGVSVWKYLKIISNCNVAGFVVTSFNCVCMTPADMSVHSQAHPTMLGTSV